MAETKQVPVAVPETMLAVRVRGPNDIFLDPAAPVPTVRPGYLLIRVLSVALNPSDHKRSALFDDEVPHTIGCDAAGVVVSCGEHLGQDYRPGDRVAGLCYGMKPGDATSGAFGQYALLRGTLSMRIPDHVSDAEAATLPVGLNFAGQALYQTLGLPLPVPVPDTSSSPDDDAGQRAGPSVLVYGGATATGMMALQLARLSGCRVLAACSPRNAQLVRALGAHDVFDYRAGADACAAAVRAAAGGGLLYALDCVAAGDSLRICAGALSPRPGVARYAASLPVGGRFPRSDVEAGWTSGYDGTYVCLLWYMLLDTLRRVFFLSFFFPIFSLFWSHLRSDIPPPNTRHLGVLPTCFLTYLYT